MQPSEPLRAGPLGWLTDGAIVALVVAMGIKTSTNGRQTGSSSPLTEAADFHISASAPKMHQCRCITILHLIGIVHFRLTPTTI